MRLEDPGVVAVAAGEEIPVFAEHAHPPPVIRHHAVLHRGAGVEPREELEAVPVVGVSLPVPVRPENFRPVLSDQVHQLRQDLGGHEGSGGQVVLLVCQVERVVPLVQAVVQTKPH